MEGQRVVVVGSALSPPIKEVRSESQECHLLQRMHSAFMDNNGLNEPLKLRICNVRYLVPVKPNA